MGCRIMKFRRQDKQILSSKSLHLAGILLLAVMLFTFIFTNDLIHNFWGIRKISNFELYMVEGFAAIQIIAPLFPLLAVLGYFQTSDLFVFSYPRTKHPQKYVTATIVKYCLAAGLVLFLYSLIYLAIGAFWLDMPEQGVPREILSELLGTDFYYQHTVLYFVLENFVKFFLFPCVYALFGISFTFLVQKAYLCVLIPFAYFDIGAILVTVIDQLVPVDLFFLSPAYPLMWNAARYRGIAFILFPLLLPLVFSIVVINRGLKKGDAYVAFQP